MSHHEPTVDGCTCGWQHGLTEGDEPCVHGHFDCAQTEGGPCTNQRIAERFAHHLNTEGSVMTLSPDAARSIPLFDAEGRLAELDYLTQAFPEGAGFPEDYASGGERNACRASYVVPALNAYAERTHCTGEPLEQIIRDLLSELMHLTDLLRDEDGEGVEFDSLVERATTRYLEEVTGQ